MITNSFKEQLDLTPLKLFSLLLIFVFSLAACGGNDTKSATQPKEKVEEQKQPVPPAPPKPDSNVPAFETLTKINQLSRYNIEAVNGENLAKLPRPVPVTGEHLKLSGWAVDAPSKNVAGGVYVQVGDKNFLAAYGKSRPDVANVLRDKQYLNSAFSIVIPTSELSKGLQDLEINVVSHDQKSYYSPRKDIVLKVDVK